MTLSVWRYAHLLLALVSCVFLFAASVTGVILAVEVVQEKTQPYKVEQIDTLTVAQVLPGLRDKYPELLQISIDHNQFVIAEGFDAEGNDFNAYIDVRDGKLLGNPVPKSEFYQWNLALHRSLFLHETGRFIVGIVSFMLMLIVVSGTILIIKRQQGIRHFFDRMSRDFLAQYYHVVAGRILLIPIFILALTGTYLFLARFELLGSQDAVKISAATQSSGRLELADFPLFKITRIVDLVKLEFPLDEDPAEYYVLHLKDRVVKLHQETGEIVEAATYPLLTVWENLSLDLHTGRTNLIWAIVLGIASLNILFFIYSGFAITLKRRSVKFRNKFKATEANYVLLVGSENGSTPGFANQVHNQLLAQGKKSYLTELNQYKEFTNATHLVVFSSTFGLGDAPSNANEFEERLKQFPQQQQVSFSVVGFGSRTYEDFCGFAVKVDRLLEEQTWAARSLELHTVNDKSKEDFVHWIRTFNQVNQLSLATTAAMYGGKPPALKSLKVLEKTSASTADANFSIQLQPVAAQRFRSGDLLAIYPGNDDRERLYSISKHRNLVQLIVKLHENGLGSSYLHSLKTGDTIKARIIQNPSFHFPAKTKLVAMIANGTGIAPFLGMLEENTKAIPVRLYAGFRQRTPSVDRYEVFATDQLAKKQLQQFNLAFSREQECCYVMNLVQRDAEYFVDLLQQGGVIMICGSLAMQQDVETLLNQICMDHTGVSLLHYKTNGQLLTDCY